MYQVAAAMAASNNKTKVKVPVNFFFFFFATCWVNACKSAEKHLNKKINLIFFVRWAGHKLVKNPAPEPPKTIS